MLVEMGRSAVFGCLGQVGGQLGLRQVQDRLAEVGDGVEDAAWELRFQHRHLGGDEGRRRGLHGRGCLLGHGGWGRRGLGGWLLRLRLRRLWLLLRRRRLWLWLWRRWWRLLGRLGRLLRHRGWGRLHLLMVVVMVLLLVPSGMPLLFRLWSHFCLGVFTV